MYRIYPNKLITLLAVILLSVVSGSGQGTKTTSGGADIAELELRLVKDSTDTDALRQLCRIYTGSLDFVKVVDYSRRLARVALFRNDDSSAAAAFAYCGQAFMAMNEGDSALYYLNKGLDRAENIDNKADNGWTRITLYNALGVHALSVEMDYKKALTIFHKGLELCEEYENEKSYIVIAGNLVRTYFLRNEFAGMGYARNIYEIGRRTQDAKVLFTGSYLCALMYYLKKDYETAAEFIGEAFENFSQDYIPAEVYILYANVLLELGKDAEALHYYRLALENIDNIDYTTATHIYLSYGRYLISKGEYQEAIEYLNKGLSLSLEKGITVYRYLIYRGLSEAHRAINDHRNALEYFSQYHMESDSIFNVERESAINELRIKYETEKVEKELQESKIAVLRSERNLQALVFIVVIIGTVLGGTYILYRRKNKLYLRIVMQNQEYVRQQNRLQEKIKQLKAHEVKEEAGEKYSVSSLSEEKGKNLFTELEELMVEKKIYREKYLTKERVAEMLNTNRTYLSQAINENTGLSFNHYINSYRIGEARRTLSDPGADVVLKALASDLGFNSMTTFYKLFQNEVGMTPSKFREKVVEISRK